MYLALHVELKEYRAIKKVPKAASDYEQFLKEALLLKRLRHPGIPIVYDVFDDSQYSYLIEEYLEGDSLYDLVNKRGPLNQETAIQYGIQICDLIHYLHSAEEIPILYLDLQPRNLIVCHGQVKLLDFDHSDTETGSNEASSRYGTPGYIAPEQRHRGQLGVYTDIYQIGAVMRYLLTGRSEQEVPVPDEFGRLSAVIRKCLRQHGEERYASALELREELQRLCSNTECISQSQSPPLIIALAGTRHGVGVTHLAVGLSVFLNQSGYLTLYEEANHSNDVRTMAINLDICPDSYGIYTIFGLPMRPLYGQAVSLKACRYPVIVRDYGTDISALEKTAGEISSVWLVKEGKWWAKQTQIEEDFCILYNFMLPGALKRKEGGGAAGRSYRAPMFENPFRPGEEASSFYGELVSKQLNLCQQQKRGRLWNCFKKRWSKRS